MRVKNLLLPAFALASVLATAQSSPSLSIAGSAGVYMPRSSEIKDLFGSTQYSIGIQPWTGNSTRSGLVPEVSFINGSSNGNKFLVIPLVYAYEYDFTSNSGNVYRKQSYTPYIRPSAGAAYFDYSITRASGAHYGLKRLGGAVGLEAGVKMGSNAKAYAKYNILTTEQHFDFSGAQIGVVLSFSGL